MSLLLALARAEQQRQRHRPLDHVLHTLCAAVQHEVNAQGVWLAEVLPDDAGDPTLRRRAATGTLECLALERTSPAVTTALFGTASQVAPGEGGWSGDQPGHLVPIGLDGETHAILALAAERSSVTHRVMAEVRALGTVISTWLEAARGAHAERRARRRLEAASARYRAVMHDALDAILLTDENGRVVEANHQADRLLPDDQSWFGRRLADHAVVGEKLPVGRHTLELRHDGTPVDAAVHAIPSADGPLKVVVLRDTVEQRRAADALRDLNDQLRQRVDELGVLSRENALLGELGAFLQASRDRGEVYAVVKRFALELFPGSGALYTLEEGELELRAQWGSSTLPAHPEARGCWSLRRGEIHACDGPDGLPCTHAEDHDGPSVCIPVMSSTGPVALVHLRLPAGAVWSDRSERLLRALADRLGAALTTLALQQRLLQESIRDPLTRLYNRRYMVETMERELARTRRAGQPLAVVMLDVDRFKRLNDTHGHDVGDRVLQEVARRLAGAVRTEDVVCRYGGEEFVAILPGATLELARARAEAFRLQLASGIGSNLPTVTISAGVAMSRDAQSPERLLRLADEALLEAKRSGRDRVIVADQGSETRSLRLAADQST